MASRLNGLIDSGRWKWLCQDKGESAQGASSATVLSDARRRAYRGDRRSSEFQSAFSGSALVSGCSRHRTLGGVDHSAAPRLVVQPLLRLRVERAVSGRLSLRQALELAA